MLILSLFSGSDEFSSPNKSPKSPLSRFFWRRKNSTKSTKSLVGESFWKKEVGLAGEPSKDIEIALKTLKTLKTTISRFITSLKPLIHEADTVLQNASRPNCGNCNDNTRCMLTKFACRIKFEKFDRLIKAGGPMCDLSKKDPNKHPTGESSSSQCLPTPAHDHLHITNHHRLFLESLQHELNTLFIIYCQLASLSLLYRTTPSRLHEKRKQSNSHIVGYWSNISQIQRDFDWVWGYQRSLECWEDFKHTCQNVSGTLVGIEEVNRRMMMYSARNPTKEMEKQLRGWEARWGKMYNSVRMPVLQREVPSPGQKGEDPYCSWCVEYDGPRGDAVKMKENEVGEVGFRSMLRGGVERLKRQRSKSKRKEKGKGGEMVSEEEERVLYGIPLLRERCKDCLEYELYEEATRQLRRRE